MKTKNGFLLKQIKDFLTQSLCMPNPPLLLLLILVGFPSSAVRLNGPTSSGCKTSFEIEKDIQFSRRFPKEMINLRNRKGETFLHEVAQTGSIAEVEWLVERGANLHFKNWEGNTPPHLASSLGMLDLFLKQGADLNIRNNKGRNVLTEFIHRWGASRGLPQIEILAILTYAHKTKVSAEDFTKVQELLFSIKHPS